MRNSSSLDWLRFMHTPNDYRVSPKNSWQFKKMDRNNNIHLQNVRYLLNRLDAAESNEEKNREEVAV